MSRNVKIALLAFACVVFSCKIFAQTEAYGKPTGIVRIHFDDAHNGDEEKCVSVPFIPFDNALNAFLNEQLTGANVINNADRISKFNTATQQYEYMYKAAGFTGDDAVNNGKWFNEFSTWTDLNFIFSPGEAFWILNRQPYTAQNVFFMGKIILDSSRSITFNENTTLFSYPFSSKISVNSTSLFADGAQGNITQDDAPDWLSTTIP